MINRYKELQRKPDVILGLYNGVENSIKESIFLLSPIYDPSSNALVDFLTLDVNDAATKSTGFSYSGLIGGRYSELCPFFIDIFGIFKTVLDTKNPYTGQITYLDVVNNRSRKFPEDKVYDVTIIPVGEYLIVVIDTGSISNNSLIDAERIKVIRQKIRDAGHDFRTPLTVINTSLYLAKKTSDSVARTTHIDNASQQVGHLINLLEELTSTVKDSGIVDDKSEIIVFPDFIKMIVDEIRIVADEKQQKLIFDSRSGEVNILGVPQKLYRAFANIIRNALTYTPVGGEISVSVIYDNSLIVRVKDNGIGIAPEMQSRIFERGFRVNPDATTDDIEGAGLGLSISNDIIKWHGGSITVISEIDKGSLFEIRLPVGVNVEG